jgi:hypothetical protein
MIDIISKIRRTICPTRLPPNKLSSSDPLDIEEVSTDLHS